MNDEITSDLWNLQIHYCVHKNLINWTHVLALFPLIICFNIIFISMPSSSKQSPSLRISTNNSASTLQLSQQNYIPCPSHPPWQQYLATLQNIQLLIILFSPIPLPCLLSYPQGNNQPFLKSHTQLTFKLFCS